MAKDDGLMTKVSDLTDKNSELVSKIVSKFLTFDSKNEF